MVEEGVEIGDVDDAVEVGVAEKGGGEDEGAAVDGLAGVGGVAEDRVVGDGDAEGVVGLGEGAGDAGEIPFAVVARGGDGGGEGGELGVAEGFDEDVAGADVEGGVGGEGGRAGDDEGAGGGLGDGVAEGDVSRR